MNMDDEGALRAPDIVAKLPRRPNPLVGKHTYAKLGRNNVFEARPAVVHFGGYSLHRTHEQTLRLVNVTGCSQRLHIVKPTTPYFKIRCAKKGIIAPGMAEEIVIEFQPTEWRYYYDCVRIHVAKENLLVPVHAYPVMNEVRFPRRIDFGVCPLTTTVTKRFSLECKVPIQFEFELTRHNHMKNKKLPFTVTACFKEPAALQVPEAWRILGLLVKDRECFPDHFKTYRKKVLSFLSQSLRWSLFPRWTGRQVLLCSRSRVCRRLAQRIYRRFWHL